MRAKRRAALILLAAGILVGCAGEDGRSGVPDPDLGGMEPQVAALLREARQAVLSAPDSADAWGGLASAYDAHSLFDLAEIGYRRAVELAPRDFRWTYLRAIVREINGAEKEEVVALFGRAAELRPDYAPIYVRLGDALSRRGVNREARVALERAIELDPTIPVAHRRLGQVMLSLGDPETALAHLTRAASLEPADLAVYSALSQAYMRLGRPERAEEAVVRSKGLEPINAMDDPIFGELVFGRSLGSGRVFKRAMARIRDGRYREAIADLEIVLEARPEMTASVHYWIGTSYQRLEEVDPAMRHLSEAIEVNPRMNMARLQLADLLAARGRTDEAIAHCERALRYAPADTTIHSRLAELRKQR